MARRRETALITGASGGIGLELARVFAREGFDLILVARRAQALEALADECRRRHDARVFVHPADLLAPDAVASLVEGIEKDGARVDVLVNNAGLMEIGALDEMEPEAIERLLQLNVVVPTELTRALLPAMIERGRGRILNVASVSAFQPIPMLGLYAASKAFVLSLSESLSEQLRGTGVTVTALCPGFTRTDMLEQAQASDSGAQDIPGFMISDVRDVAREGFDACMAGTVVDVPGLPNRLMASTVGFYPRWLVRGLGGLMARRAKDRS